MLNRILSTRDDRAMVLVRLLVGLVVFFPWPELMGPFVGVVEMLCGALIILGLFTRVAAVPLIIIMIVAIVSTKLPILLGREFWIFSLPDFKRYGFWSMQHEARTDLCMLLGSLYLLIRGSGSWSLDLWLTKRRVAQQSMASAKGDTHAA